LSAPANRRYGDGLKLMHKLEHIAKALARLPLLRCTGIDDIAKVVDITAGTIILALGINDYNPSLLNGGRLKARDKRFNHVVAHWVALFRILEGKTCDSAFYRHFN